MSVQTVRSGRLLGGYVRRHFLAWTAGWSFALTIYISRLVAPLVGLALWTKAVPEDPRVATYFVALVFSVMATDSPENHTFAQRVYDGSFTDDLLRPHPVALSTVGFNLAFKAFNMLGVLPVVVFVALATDVRADPLRVLMALPALVIGSCICFLLMFTLAQSSFWTPRVHAVTALGQTMVFMAGGGAAPIPLLPDELSWVRLLPFRAINGFACEIASGLTTGADVARGYALQVLWLAVFIVGSRTVWRAGVRRYVAIGG